ncbi:hypothetical protein ACA910_001318 [Epithemia clementina (nom. ined.)]
MTEATANNTQEETPAPSNPKATSSSLAAAKVTTSHPNGHDSIGKESIGNAPTSDGAQPMATDAAAATDANNSEATWDVQIYCTEFCRSFQSYGDEKFDLKAAFYGLAQEALRTDSFQAQVRFYNDNQTKHFSTMSSFLQDKIY